MRQSKQREAEENWDAQTLLQKKRVFGLEEKRQWNSREVWPFPIFLFSNVLPKPLSCEHKYNCTPARGTHPPQINAIIWKTPQWKTWTLKNTSMFPATYSYKINAPACTVCSAELTLQAAEMCLYKNSRSKPWGFLSLWHGLPLC